MNTTDTHTTTESTLAPGASRFSELQQMIAGMAADFEKFYVQGNKAAGTRVRAAMQELKAYAQTVRNEVQTMKNEGKGEA